MSTLNVRLTTEDAVRIRRLREHGVEISQLVRDAIRVEDERRNGHGRRHREPRGILKNIYEAFPIPDDVRPRFNVRDRHAFREAVAMHTRTRKHA